MDTSSTNNVISQILTNLNSTKTALRYLRTPTQTENISYSTLLRSAIIFALRHLNLPNKSNSLQSCLIMVEEGPEVAIAELAAMIAGYVIVPVSPNDPPSRLRYILEDTSISIAIVPNLQSSEHLAQAQALLTTSSASSSSSSSKFPILLASNTITNQTTPSSEELTTAIATLLQHPLPTLDAISHIFFTSGSTGRPKGCVSTHRALVSYCRGKNQAHNITANSVVFVASPHTFDPHIGDLFATWMVGATVALAPRTDTFTALGRCLSDSKATHVLTTPALLNTMPNGPPKCYNYLPLLQTVALGGEATPSSLAHVWIPHLENLFNTYGVTECAVYQAIATITKTGNPQALGQPLPGNVLLYVQEPGDDPTKLVAEKSGELAELWIAGPQVGLGYSNRTKLTSERFVRNEKDGSLYFRTGDIVRMDKEHGPVLLGRRDDQVKLNGQRVELGEVEAGILKGAGEQLIKAVAAVVIKEKGGCGGKRLVAWCVPASKTALCLDIDVVDGGEDEDGGDEDENVDCGDNAQHGRRPDIPVASIFHDVLRYLIQKELPLHMLPSRIGFMPSLPVTSSGKIARRPLLRRGVPLAVQRHMEEDEDNTITERNGNADEEEKKKDPLIEIVCQIWSTVLGVPNKMATHFTEMGGDSLAALRACLLLSQTMTVENDNEKNTTTSTKNTTTSFAGEALGVFSPLELLKRPLVTEYVKYLRVATQATPVIPITPTTQAAPTTQTTPPTLSSQLEDEGKELLYRASLSGAYRCVERLLQLEISPHEFHQSSPLHAACSRGNVQSARVLLDAGVSCNARNVHGSTPLMLAVATSNVAGKRAVKLVKLLIKRGAMLGCVDDSGQSALHAAARSGQSNGVLACLLEACLQLKGSEAKVMRSKGSMLLWKDSFGRTALSWAAVNGHRSACVFLLGTEEGQQANTMKDNDGEKPVDSAERRALCSAKERPDGARSSVWGDIATLLGGSGTTKHLKGKK